MTAVNEHQFMEAIERHAGIFHKLIRLYADDQEDQRDLYQEMLFEAWRAFPSFRGDAALSTWLYRVALNTALTFRRKALRRLSTEELTDSRPLPADERPALSPQAERLYLAIRALPELDRALVTLHLEDYNHEEIASMLGLSKNNVAVRLHRIKAQLQTKLNP